MANEQLASKIRNALQQLDPANDQHWTEDGLPREGVVRKLANDNAISRNDISTAYPGFQRHPTKPAASAEAQAGAAPIDPLTGEPTVNAAPGSGTGVVESDPTTNTGEFMSDDEVRAILEHRVNEATQALTDAQAAVRAAHKGVTDAQAKVQQAREDLSREFPPMTKAQNIKEYIASEQAQRAAAHGFGGIAPGSQIDMAMQRSNSRGWRRPSRNGPVQSGAAKVT